MMWFKHKAFLRAGLSITTLLYHSGLLDWRAHPGLSEGSNISLPHGGATCWLRGGATVALHFHSPLVLVILHVVDDRVVRVRGDDGGAVPRLYAQWSRVERGHLRVPLYGGPPRRLTPTGCCHSLCRVLISLFF